MWQVTVEWLSRIASVGCATGTFHYAPTLIVLSRPRMKCGFRVFTRGTFRFAGEPPLGGSTDRTISWTLDVFPCVD
jgi:hypothetical protein